MQCATSSDITAPRGLASTVNMPLYCCADVICNCLLLACRVNSYQDDITIPWTSEWLEVGYTECLAEFRARRAAGNPNLKLLLFTQVQEMYLYYLCSCF
jgi:hypothetical protein